MRALLAVPFWGIAFILIGTGALFLWVGEKLLDYQDQKLPEPD